MKKVILNLFTLTAITVGFTSCSDDDDNNCHECHIAYMTDNGEVQGDIGEFCDEALEDIENNGYNLADDIVVGDVTIPAGEYTADEVHCEEHGDHEDHEHD